MNLHSAAGRHTALVLLSAPQAMLLLGATGMVLGLIVDSRSTGLDTLESLCAAADRTLWSMMQLHWALLPWMHAGMWAGGLAAIPFLRVIRRTCRRQYCARLAQSIACSALMTVGMSAGVLITGYLASPSGARSPSAMFGGMFAGMVCAMVASVALYRLALRGRFVAPNFGRRGAELP